MRENIFAAVFAALIAFTVCVCIGPFFVPFLRKLKFGQEIREIGPSWHKSKRGTPTMGGIIFIISVTAVSLLFDRDKKTIMLVCLSLAFGFIGLADDFIKVVMKRNLGLTEKQKFLMQLLASVLFIYIGLHFELFDTSMVIPFLKKSINIGWIYIPLMLFIIIGGTNSVNLTDGVDGLATSVTIVVTVFFAIVALMLGEISVAIFSASLAGALVGFLIFNIHPAKVFMGDTGSLYLGGAVCGIALVLKMPLILAIVGLWYVVETLSVIIQVTSFKLTGKRVFKMSPIHHHFEMCGWSENKIVSSAVILTVVLAIIGYIACF